MNSHFVQGFLSSTKASARWGWRPEGIMLLLYGISNENWADEEILAGLARSLDYSQLTSMGTLKVRRSNA